MTVMSIKDINNIKHGEVVHVNCKRNNWSGHCQAIVIKHPDGRKLTSLRPINKKVEDNFSFWEFLKPDYNWIAISK